MSQATHLELQDRDKIVDKVPARYLDEEVVTAVLNAAVDELVDGNAWDTGQLASTRGFIDAGQSVLEMRVQREQQTKSSFPRE